LFPLIATFGAPAPVIVRLVLIVSVLARVMVPVTLKLIVSPDDALAIAFRSEPAPLSARLVTVYVVAEAGMTLRAASITAIAVIPIRNCGAKRLVIRW